MQYRKLKKTGESLSVLGFGCMRLPVINDEPTRVNDELAIPMLRKAIDSGVNYVDTAYPYHSNDLALPGESEPFVGRALRDGYRDKVRIATKLPPWLLQNRDDMERILDHQLERLQTGTIDNYLLHGLNSMSWPKLQQFGVFEFVERALGDGRIKQIGFSFHDGPELFREIVDAYDWSFCQIQYNYLDENNQAGKSGLEYAAEKGLGVVIMEPLRGGNLANRLPEDAAKILAGGAVERSHAEWALRWVWNHPEVTTVLSGMSEMAEVEENLRIAADAGEDSLTDDELLRIDKVKKIFRERMKIPCTKCRYCMPCPEGVDIPGNLSSYNEYHLFTAERHRLTTTRLYGLLVPAGARPDKCTECGRCLEHCPQQINIPEELKNVAATFPDKAS